MYYEQNDSVRVVYESRRLTTGLSDVKIDIWDPNGNLVVSQQSMTELGSGIYYYDYTVGSVGAYIYQADSLSNQRTAIDKIIVKTPLWSQNIGSYSNITDSFAQKLKNASERGGGDGISGDIVYYLNKLTNNEYLTKKDLEKSLIEFYKYVYEGNESIRNKINEVIKNSLNNKDLKKIDSKFSDLKKDLNTINKKEEAYKSLYTDLNKINKDIKKVGKDIGDNSKEVINLKRDLNEYSSLVVDNILNNGKSISLNVDTKIDEIKKDSDNKDHIFNAKLKTHEKHFDNIKNKLANLEEGINHLKKDYGEIPATISNNFNNIKKDVDNLNKLSKGVSVMVDEKLSEEGTKREKSFFDLKDLIKQNTEKIDSSDKNILAMLKNKRLLKDLEFFNTNLEEIMKFKTEDKDKIISKLKQNFELENDKINKKIDSSIYEVKGDLDNKISDLSKNLNKWINKLDMGLTEKTVNLQKQINFKNNLEMYSYLKKTKEKEE